MMMIFWWWWWWWLWWWWCWWWRWQHIQLKTNLEPTHSDSPWVFRKLETRIANIIMELEHSSSRDRAPVFMGHNCFYSLMLQRLDWHWYVFLQADFLIMNHWLVATQTFSMFTPDLWRFRIDHLWGTDKRSMSNHQKLGVDRITPILSAMFMAIWKGVPQPDP